MTFSGDAVAVYGGVSFDHGNYTVTIDGKSQVLNGGTARTYHPQVSHYYQISKSDILISSQSLLVSVLHELEHKHLLNSHSTMQMD